MNQSRVYYSNLKESLQKIYELHWEAGNEAHSKLGWDLKQELERQLRSKTTEYSIKKNKKGNRQIVKVAAHAMGDRFDAKNGDKLSVNMGNFIQFRTYATTGTTVVGVPMKAGKTEIRRDGKVVSSKKVFGIRQESIDILEKMSLGIVGVAKWVHPRGVKSMKGFEGTHQKHPNNFIPEAKAKALSNASSKIEKEYSAALERSKNVKSPPMKKV